MKTVKKGKLRCATCGNDSSFEFNDEKTYVKCTVCNREYLGGYDELLELNAETIEEMKNEIAVDLKKEIVESLKQSLKGNKNIKFN
ncbi:MAG TPA: hypothetical protein DCL77_01705 [Prolixibacteraceae bacterium]|jgi:ribosomal protein S27E|nr:hypothetical protein [Prolixibacteraceae bacterium]